MRPLSRAAASAASSLRSTMSRPLSQKPGSARSTPTIAPSSSGDLRPAGRQQLQVGGGEARALLLVAAVDGERQQLAVRVRVDVARRGHEVGDVGPPRLVVVGDLDGVAQQLLLGVRPQLAEAVDGELALVAPRGVHEVLEAVHRDLAEDRRDRAFDRLRQQRQARLGRRGRVQEPPEHERLAEHRRGLGQRQRRRHVVDALLGPERGVHAMPELVRQRQHVAAQVRVVQQHVRVHARHAVGAERAAALAGAHRPVDPVLVEEAVDQRAELVAEGRVGVEHDLLGLRPGDLLVVLRHRRHAVVVRELVDAQQLRLQAIPAARQLVASAHRLDQRLHGLVGGLVGQVARRQPVRVVSAAGRRSSCPRAAC